MTKQLVTHRLPSDYPAIILTSLVSLMSLARFILEMDQPSWTNFHTNWASNDSSSDNSSVYKYGQTDGSSIQTSYLDNSSSSTNYPNTSSGRIIRPDEVGPKVDNLHIYIQQLLFMFNKIYLYSTFLLASVSETAYYSIQ